MPYVVSLIGKHAGEVVEMPFNVADACVNAQGTHRWATEDEQKLAGIPQEGFPMVQEDVLPAGYALKPDEVQGWHVLDPGGVPLTVDPLENAVQAREFAWAYHAETAAGRPANETDEQREEREKAEADRRKAAEEQLQAKRDAQRERMDRYGLRTSPQPKEDQGPQRERVPPAREGSDKGNPKPAKD